ncbi:MAG: DMT family transporter [Oscillospiraceae bacterium]|nr:DMT family transporter [Oscillospiraceae bacterium]
MTVSLPSGCFLFLLYQFSDKLSRRRQKTESKQSYKGILLIILSAFCFAWMNAFVRLAGDLPSVQKSFFRNAVALVIAALTLLRNRKDFHFQKEGMGFLVLRALFGTIGILCNFYAIDHLVLSDASMLNKMSPFFTLLFSWILLKEKLRPVQAAAVITAFLGSLLIIRPSLHFTDFSASFAGLCGGIAAGAAYAMVRILGQKGMNKTFIVLFFSGFSCLCTAPFLLLDFHPMTWVQLLMLLGAGLAAAGGQFSITAAYCYAPAKEISVYDYSQIIFATSLGFFLFGEVPDIWSFIGYGIIIFAAVGMFWYNQIYQKQKSS